jgi:hypothetical protein
MGLQGFERRLERVFEGMFAKAFRSGLEPVELGRRLAREIDRQRRVGSRGTIAPNQFAYTLSHADMERFASFADALTSELAEAARIEAKDEGYRFLGPVEVTLTEDPALSPGTFDLAAQIVGAPGGAVGSLVLPGGERVQLGDEPITLGRLDECDVVLNDATVSRRHAEVHRVDDGYEVVDLGSRNGTRVNGRGVVRERLDDGDELSVGAVGLRFESA